MDKFDPWQILRYALIAGGTMVAARTPNISDADVQAVVGSVVALAAAMWGIFTRWNTAAVPASHASLPTVPVQSSATGQIWTGPGT